MSLTALLSVSDKTGVLEFARALPGGETFRARMNLIDDAELQARAVSAWFDALADAHHRLPAPFEGISSSPDATQEDEEAHAH